MLLHEIVDGEAVRADLPHLITSLPGPRAKAIIERDAAVLSPSYTRSYPLVAERGEGAIVEDIDGNRFLGSLSLTASKSVQRKGFGALLGGIFHAPFPNPYRRTAGQTLEDCAMDSIRFIEDKLLRGLVSPDEVAAIFVEPVQGEGGYVV